MLVAWAGSGTLLHPSTAQHSSRGLRAGVRQKAAVCFWDGVAMSFSRHLQGVTWISLLALIAVCTDSGGTAVLFVDAPPSSTCLIYTVTSTTCRAKGFACKAGVFQGTRVVPSRPQCMPMQAVHL